MLLAFGVIALNPKRLISYGSFARTNSLNRAFGATPNSGVGTQCYFLIFFAMFTSISLLTLTGRLPASEFRDK